MITVQRAIKTYVMAAVAVLCAGLIAMTPMRLTTPPLPQVAVPAVALTSLDVSDPVPDPMTFDYLINTEIPEFWSTVSSTYQTQFADLSSIFSDWSAGGGMSWTDGGDSITVLNNDVLDWLTNFNQTGLNLVEAMGGPDPATGLYDPSLCNILVNFSAAGNAWLDELNTGAGAGMDGFNQGLGNFFDGVNTFALDLANAF